MDFESLSLFHIGVPLLFVFGAIHFGICFVRRDALRKALRVVAFLPIAAAAAYVVFALLWPHGGGFVDDGAFAAALIGIPALFALGGSVIGLLVGRLVKKKRE
ncbi:MAG: hypothetical protein IKR49_11475 [Clostridia bacterium]|nr:hypothetical protein [Clostridia bacterium]